MRSAQMLYSDYELQFYISKKQLYERGEVINVSLLRISADKESSLLFCQL